MDNCLLCLKVNQKITDRIKVNSTQWEKQHRKNIIEKHIWPLENCEPFSWICTTCWQELYTFHKFYTRIEEAHLNLVPVLEETNYETCLTVQNPSDDEDSNNLDDCKDFSATEASVENPLSIKDDDIIGSETVSLSETKEPQKYSIKDESDASEPSKEPSISLDSSHDSDTDSECRLNEPNSKPTNKKLKTSEDKNKFIAENFQLTCDLCQISIENFSVLRKHFMEIHGSYAYAKCCERRFVGRMVLIDHINSHLNPDYLKCERCGRVLSTRAILEAHMAKHHKDVQHEYPYTCDICGQHYKIQAKFKAHKLKHKNKEFSCTECGKFCDTIIKLRNHKRVHAQRKKYLKICDICGKTLHDRNAFVAHMNIHENKQPPPLSCDICGLQLVDIRGLNGHKKRQHPVDGIKEYPCHTCQHVSPNQQALRTHIQLAHVKGHDHKCTICDKAFKRPVGLREHMATHTGEALYKCNWCPKTFISSGNIHKHRKNSHPEEWEKSRWEKSRYQKNKLPVTTDING